MSRLGVSANDETNVAWGRRIEGGFCSETRAPRGDVAATFNPNVACPRHAKSTGDVKNPRRIGARHGRDHATSQTEIVTGTLAVVPKLVATCDRARSPNMSYAAKRMLNAGRR